MPIRFITMIVAAGLFPACAPGEPGAAVEPPAAVEAPTPAQAVGWRDLFNGTDLSGWKSYKGDTPGDGWVVEEGAITLSSGGAGDLVTADDFGPFELVLEWRVAPKGNSGVIYLVNEVEGAGATWHTGPEMQVLDNDGHRDGAFPSHRAGTLYDLAVPASAGVKPVGDWNEARILFTGSRIEHWLNGEKLVDVSYGDEDWAARVAGSKFRDMPHFGKASSGRIALQDHGDRVWYRNIRIRAL